MKFALIAFALVGFSVHAQASMPDPAVCGNNSYSAEFKISRSAEGGIPHDNVEVIIMDAMANNVGIYRQAIELGSLEKNLIKTLTVNEIDGGKSKLSIKASNSDIDQLFIKGIGQKEEELFCNLLN